MACIFTALSSHQNLFISGATFVEERTSACEYHFNESIRKHEKHASDVTSYHKLIDGMKNAPTDIGYIAKKDEFDALVQSSPNEKNLKSLENFIKFWDERKFRWAMAYRKHSVSDIPRNSLAESAHAKMKSGGRRNLSLVDAAHTDIEESATFEAKWQKRMDGEKSSGTGPRGIHYSFIFILQKFGRYMKSLQRCLKLPPHL